MTSSKWPTGDELNGIFEMLYQGFSFFILILSIFILLYLMCCFLLYFIFYDFFYPKVPLHIDHGFLFNVFMGKTSCVNECFYVLLSVSCALS